MQGSARRRSFTRNGVVAGSVWEARMRVDAVNGGIKVFNGEESRDGDGDGDGNADEEGMRVYRRLRRNQSDSIAAGRRRRIWTPPPSSASSMNGSIGGSPIPLHKARSELAEDSRELGGVGRVRVLAIGDGSEGVGGDDGEVEMEDEVGRESFDDKEMDLPVEKGKSVEEEEKTINQVHEIPASSPPVVEKKQNCAEIATSPAAEKQEQQQSQRAIDPDPIEPPPYSEKKKMNHRIVDPDPVEPPPHAEKKRINHKIIDPDPVEPPPHSEKKKMNHRIIDSDAVELRPYAEKKKMNHRTIDTDPVEPPSFEGAKRMFDSKSGHHNRLQSIVDLVMWREIPKSAFVFGLGTFILMSSSYAKDLNFSLISATSYLGLIYLALIFVYKSILHRGESVEYDESYMVGEEEAIWLLRLLLPYINELLLKIRALFSGDPATTMKLAVLLFVMARCGNSITIWTLSRLSFFGVFTVPKICSSYSTQLAKYGNFWVERIRDGWESCSHKKAVAAAIFTLIWNISSTVARIWAVFMLVVAVKYYQQCVAEEWPGREEVVVVEEVQEVSKPAQSLVQAPGLHHRHRGGTAVRERKQKKGM
uniref:Reticulon-like protein n=1 Tax=Musa acuminata subsp. malaccensis TaxID=214687 RepID=A0A804IKX6_MUSAM|nr:PREDICTED: reticulon-like protein B21 isoform X1 [Musa acuminata subsp. malaccensis]